MGRAGRLPDARRVAAATVCGDRRPARGAALRFPRPPARAADRCATVRRPAHRVAAASSPPARNRSAAPRGRARRASVARPMRGARPLAPRADGPPAPRAPLRADRSPENRRGRADLGPPRRRVAAARGRPPRAPARAPARGPDRGLGGRHGRRRARSRNGPADCRGPTPPTIRMRAADPLRPTQSETARPPGRPGVPGPSGRPKAAMISSRLRRAPQPVGPSQTDRQARRGGRRSPARSAPDRRRRPTRRARARSSSTRWRRSAPGPLPEPPVRATSVQALWVQALWVQAIWAQTFWAQTFWARALWARTPGAGDGPAPTSRRLAPPVRRDQGPACDRNAAGRLSACGARPARLGSARNDRSGRLRPIARLAAARRRVPERRATGALAGSRRLSAAGRPSGAGAAVLRPARPRRAPHRPWPHAGPSPDPGRSARPRASGRVSGRRRRPCPEALRARRRWARRLSTGAGAWAGWRRPRTKARRLDRARRPNAGCLETGRQAHDPNGRLVDPPDPIDRDPRRLGSSRPSAARRPPNASVPGCRPGPKACR